MIDWSLPPDLQKLYNDIVARNQRLQKELGIKPMTLEERAKEYQRKKAEEASREASLQQLLGKRRPPPKWKV